MSPQTDAPGQPSQPMQESEAYSEGFVLLSLAVVLAKHKRMIVCIVLGAAVLSAVVAMLMPSWYTSTSSVLPPQQQSSSAAMLSQLGGLAGLAGTSLGMKSPQDLYVGLLKSQRISDAIIGRFGLKTLYDEDTLFDTRKKLDKRVSFTSGKDGIIYIEFEDKDPARAAAIANMYVDELDSVTKLLAVTEASQRRAFFEKQLVSAKDQLANAEVALKVQQESTGLIKLDDQGKAIIENVARLRGQIAAKEVQLSAMQLFAAEGNPDLARAQQELAGLRIQLARVETQRNGQGTDIFLPTGKIPEAALAYIRKVRDVKYYEAMFEVLSKQYELAKIDEAKQGAFLQVVDRAKPADKKSSPKRLVIVLASTMFSVFLAALAVVLVEGMERARQNPDHATLLARLREYFRSW